MTYNEKDVIKETFDLINKSFIEIIKNNIKMTYYKHEQDGLMNSIDFCCFETKQDFLYELYETFIDENNDDIDKISIILAILYVYYHLVSIETHDNDMLSTTRAKNSKNLPVKGYITIYHFIENDPFFNGLERKLVVQTFIKYSNGIIASDEVKYQKIRRAILNVDTE